MSEDTSPRTRRRIFQCATCTEVFIDEESYEKHLLTHAPKEPPTATPQQKPGRPTDLSRRVLLLLALAWWCLGVGWQISEVWRYQQQPAEVRQQIEPARRLLDRTLGRGRANLQVLQAGDSLKLVATLDCSPEEARQLDHALRNLLSLNSARGDELLTLRGSVSQTQWWWCSALLFLLLTLSTVIKRLPAQRFTPAPCPRRRGWMQRLRQRWTRTTPPRPLLNGREEAAVILLSLAPEVAQEVYKELGPRATALVTPVLTRLPPLNAQDRRDILKTFQGHLDTVCRRGCGAAPGSCQPGKTAATLLEFYLNSVVTISRRLPPAIPTWWDTHRRKLALLVTTPLLLALVLAALNDDQSTIQAHRLKSELSRFIDTRSMVVETNQRQGQWAAVVAWLGDRQLRDEQALVQSRALALGIEPARVACIALPSPRGIPGPLPSFLLLNLCVLTWVALKTPKASPPQPEPQPQPSPTITRRDDLDVDALMKVSPLSVEVGRGLLPLVDPNQGAKLLKRVETLRRHLACELGIVLPGALFRDDLALNPYGYAIKIREVTVARGQVRPNELLAIGPEEKLALLQGSKVTDPAYGMPALWISPTVRSQAERLGCMIFDPVSTIATQITEVVRQHAADLLDRQAFSALLETLKKTHPAVVEEALQTFPPSLLHNIAKNLLKEGVSIRDLAKILETLCDLEHTSRDLDLLTEPLRASLARNICSNHVNEEGVLRVFCLDPEIESIIETSLSGDAAAPYLDPEQGQRILQAIGAQVRLLQEEGEKPILLTSPTVRPMLRRLTERSFPHLVLLSWSEIAPQIEVTSLGCATLS